MSTQIVFSNASIVLPNDMITGSLCIENGLISDIASTKTQVPGAIDLGGDYLLPGLVELHTDNMEKHFSPRPGVNWPELPAIFGHDSVVAGAGVTTVFNAVATGNVISGSPRSERFTQMASAIKIAAESGLTRAEHFLHLRCEITCDKTLERFQAWMDDPLVRLVSIMDHSPGQRQFVDLGKYREYYQGKYHLNDQQINELIEHHREFSLGIGQTFRQSIAELCRERGIAIASHDDATVVHVEESVEMGAAIGEFPTTMEAARTCREKGLHVLMGAPNVVRGYSHSGNVSARELALEGLLDILSSDYVPESLLHSAFILAEQLDSVSLPEAVNSITLNPAQAAGLDDRGAISVGKRADLVRARLLQGVPLVREVWRQGRRVN